MNLRSFADRKFVQPIVSILAVCLIISGCGGGARYDVPPSPESVARPATVYIPPFSDKREFIREGAKLGAAPPLSYSTKYKFSRPDEAFGSAIEPFPYLFPKLVGDELESKGYFDEVIYVQDQDDLAPNPGTYDLLLQGELIDTTSQGRGFTYFLVMPLGFSLYDFAWLLGMPKFSRRYNIDMEYQWKNGYTGTEIGEPVRISYETNSKWFTQYVNETKMEDLRKKLGQSTRELTEVLGQNLPEPSDTTYYASLRTEGEAYLAELERQQSLIERGTPATFALLDPVENATLRAPVANIQWSVTSPNGLKQFSLTMNNAQLSLPLNQVAMNNEMTAPRSIPAQVNQVSLDMGQNTIAARLEDWRGNVTNESVTIYRYPQELRPENRSALMISTSSGVAEKSIRDLSSTLQDPYLGQFQSDRVTVLSNPSGKDAIRKSLGDFGSRIVAGELAFIYVTGDAETASNSIKIGSEEVSISDFLVMARESLATDQTVIFFDLDWSSQNSERVLADKPDLPQRWAIGTSAQTHTPNIDRNGRTLYADTFIKTISDSSRSDNRLTLERMFDIIAVDVEIESGDVLRPRIDGRYDPNITMSAYE